jgi:hypothetical protein
MKMFVVKKIPADTDTKMEDRKESKKLNSSSLLCTFISNQKSIRDEINTSARKFHKSKPKRMYTLSSRKKVDIHMKSNTALV